MTARGRARTLREDSGHEEDWSHEKGFGRGRLADRREVLRVLALSGAAVAAWRLGGRDRLRPVRRARVLMGTTVEVQAVGDDPDAAGAAAEAMLAHMAEHEATLSRHRPDSALSRLNATGRLDRAPQALLDVLGLAERIATLADGALDVSIQPVLDLHAESLDRHGRLPSAAEIERRLERVDQRAIRVEGRSVRLARSEMGLTLDGIGKGWVVDRGVERLRERGFPNVFVDAGGDLVASGERAGGKPWRIGIRSPRGRGPALVARFETRDRAVATSGDYMQSFTADYSRHHILDPRTGTSAPELASATVIAPDAATADALATVVMVLGPIRGRALLEDLDGCEGFLVTKELEVIRTRGFALA